MKKLTIIMFLCSIVFARDFYVSPEGTDSAAGSGSKSSPVASIARALERAEKYISLSGYPKDGITIYVAEGTYYTEETISIGSALSGTERSPLTIKAQDDEEVRLIGGYEFNLNDFSKVDDPQILRRLHPDAVGKVLSLNIKAQGITEYGKLPLYGHSMGCLSQKTRYKRGSQAPELFFEGEPMTLSRWPNEGFAEVGSVVEKGDVIRDWMDDRKGQDKYVPPQQRKDPPRGFAFKFDKQKLSRWKDAEEMMLYGYWFQNWSEQTVEVADIDEEKGIIYSLQPSAYGVKKDQRFYAYNLLEELDTPGEWFLDREEGVLYIIPPAGADGESRLHLSKMAETFIVTEDASNVAIQGIDLLYSRDGGIIVTGGENVRITDCRIGNIAGLGLRVNGGNNHTVNDCEVFNTGKGGIFLKGGITKDLKDANHIVKNCLVHNYARIETTYNPAIKLNGVGNTASHNEIHSGEHLAIGFGGNNHRIEYNHIYDVCRQTDDMAAIYAGRSWVSRGTVISNNLIRDVTGYQSGTHRVSGIYLDDGISGITVKRNIFLNVAQGLMFNGGRDNTAVDNVFINVNNMMRSTNMREAFKTWAASGWKTLNKGLKATPIDKEPWKSAYPNLVNMLEDEPDLPKYVTIKNNIRYKSPVIFGKKGIMDAVVKYGTVKNNIEIEQKPGDYDPDSRRFRFIASSGVFEEMPKLKEIPVEDIGRVK